jgi:GR25 family glycosyltransferase involved in LPS biosynthesis
MFTKILYINLDRRNDRKEYMEKELKKINWSGSVERISAVDGKTLLRDDLYNLLDENAISEFMDTSDRQFDPGSYMSKGAAGCALSHRKCWENILKGDDEKVLILEDDIQFDEKFNEKLKNYIPKIPDYDILYIGFHEARESTQYNDILKKPGYVVFGLFGYIVNKRISKKLLDMFPIRGQIDSEINKIYNDINVYHINEDLRIIYSDHSHNNSLGTDIQFIEKFNDINNKNTPLVDTLLSDLLLSDLFIYFIVFLLLCLLLPKIIN